MPDDPSSDPTGGAPADPADGSTPTPPVSDAAGPGASGDPGTSGTSEPTGAAGDSGSEPPTPPPDDEQPPDDEEPQDDADELPPMRPRVALAPLPLGRFGDYQGPGHDDASAMAGRPYSSKIHLVALALAAGADIGAFYQVISLVMRDSDDRLIYLVVAGFTATVLYLAHVAGTMLRDRKAGLTWIRGVMAWVCLAAWSAMGVVAFYIRFRVTARTGGGGVVPGIVLDEAPTAATSPAGLTDNAVLAALIFAALFVATGLVAAVGAYLNHNPLRGAYVAARRAHYRATRRAASSAEAYYLAQAEWMTQLSRIGGVNTVLQEEREQRRELADELKQYARLVIAQKGRDPALTDALFEPDRRPYGRTTSPGASPE